MLAGRLLPTGAVKDWTAFVRRDRALADAGRLLLEARGRTFLEQLLEKKDAYHGGTLRELLGKLD